jgi:predicted butyrate kinase (DUF1464 family)
MAINWDMVAALGQVASALVSFGGLWFVGWQIQAARKTADLQSLQEFVRSTAECEAALLNAVDEAWTKAFFELINHLEMQAAAVNGRLYPKVTREIVREKLRDTIAMIEAASHTHDRLQEAISTPTTFEHLIRFMRRERAEIDRVRHCLAR